MSKKTYTPQEVRKAILDSVVDLYKNSAIYKKDEKCEEIAEEEAKEEVKEHEEKMHSDKLKKYLAKKAKKSEMKKKMDLDKCGHQEVMKAKVDEGKSDHDKKQDRSIRYANELISERRSSLPAPLKAGSGESAIGRAVRNKDLGTAKDKISNDMKNAKIQAKPNLPKSEDVSLGKSEWEKYKNIHHKSVSQKEKYKPGKLNEVQVHEHGKNDFRSEATDGYHSHIIGFHSSEKEAKDHADKFIDHVKNSKEDRHLGGHADDFNYKNRTKKSEDEAKKAIGLETPKEKKLKLKEFILKKKYGKK